MNEKFANALKRQSQAVPPIWMMRQAGRYHAHYQALRKKHSFVELCKTPDLAAEVAMGPIEDFDFDAAILFSDILFPLEVLGIPLDYNPGPQMGWFLNEETLPRLSSAGAIDQLDFQAEAMRKTRERLPQDKSLIGFVGGPFTLFSYAVQGSHKGGLMESKQKMHLYPAFCEILLPLMAENIKRQYAAGAEVVMVLDTAGGEVSPQVFDQLVIPSLEILRSSVDTPLGYYSKALQPRYFDKLQRVGFQGFGYDHHWDLSQVLPDSKGFVQGNFDQSMMHLGEEQFEEQFHKWLTPLKNLSIEQRSGWVCGLGHGLTPKTPEQNVRNFVKWVRQELK